MTPEMTLEMTLEEAIAEYVEDAVLNERERCAKIVEGATHGEMTSVDGKMILVAELIRSGK